MKSGFAQRVTLWGALGFAAILLQCEREHTTGAAPVTCRLAWASKVHYAPQILADKMGWFANDSVRIVSVKLGVTTGIMAAEALISGSADIAVMGDAPALYALSSQRPCLLVAAYGGGKRMHRIITTRQSAVQTAEHLRGKKLAVQFGSSTHGALMLYLEKEGLAAESVQVLNMRFKDMADALAAGQIDLFAASEPMPALALQKNPDAREFAALDNLGNHFPLMMVTTERFAEKNPAAIELALEATRRGVDFINRSPDSAAVILSRVTGVEAAIEAEILSILDWNVRIDNEIIGSLKQTAQFLHGEGKLMRLPDIERMFYREGAQLMEGES